MLMQVEECNRFLCAILSKMFCTLLSVVHMVPIIRDTRKNLTRSSYNQLPTIVVQVPNMGSSAMATAYDRQDGADHRQACSTDHRSAIERFNDYHRNAGTGLVAEPIGRPAIRPSGPVAAHSFVRWATKHGLAREWQVEDLWHIASEDFAPALNMVLPPRRVFLGALKKTPGVICTPNRRVYDGKGKLLGKTTFYQLPTLATLETAEEIPALSVVKDAA